jgi:hypothetical protein
MNKLLTALLLSALVLMVFPGQKATAAVYAPDVQWNDVVIVLSACDAVVAQINNARLVNEKLDAIKNGRSTPELLIDLPATAAQLTDAQAAADALQEVYDHLYADLGGGVTRAANCLKFQR